MRHYIIFILVIFFSLSATAQTTSLTGIVKLTDGMPVPDAVVAIKKLNKHSVTDEKGRFKISGVKYGKHEVEVLSIEIKKQSIPIEVKNNMKPLTLVVEPSSFDLNEVVVSANTQKKELEIKGFAVNVIEPQKIAVQSIQTNELLDRTAGVRIRQDGGLGSRVKYNINGLSGEAIKIFIDGVPASNYGPAFSLSSIPPALIERIEVYKGVVPGHLAEDALGGAINIILKQRRTNSLTTSYSFGSFNTHQWNAAGSHRWDNGLTFEGSAFYNYSDNDYKVWGKDIEFREYTGTIIESNGKKVRRFHDAYESYGGKFDIGFTNVKWADQLMIGTILSQNHQDMQNGATMQVVYGDRNSKRKSEVFTLKYNKADFLLKGLTFKVDASYSFLEWQVIDTVGIMYDWAGPVRYPDGSYVRYTSGAESGNAKTVAKNNDEALMARGSLSYRIHENHTIFANLLYNDFQRKVSDKYQPEALQKLRNTRDLQKNVMAFTYENLGFSGKLRTNLFYKHYFQKVTANEPHYDTTEKQYKINTTDRKVDHGSYGFTLSFALLTDLYLLGSAERALRLPSADELFGNGSDNSLQAIGLKPERSWNVNVGFSYHYQLKEHSFGINSSVYFRDTEDMIRESIQEGRNEYTQAENLEAVLTKGFDAELTYHYADKLNVRFNVSKFDVLFNTKYNEQGHPYNYYRMQIRNEPSFKYNGQATYFLKNLFMKDSYSSIYFNINHVNGFYRNWSNVGSKNRDYIQAQYPVDLGLTYTFPKNKFALSFDIKNIFDEQIFDNYGLQKPGRAFYAKITYFIF